MTDKDDNINRQYFPLYRSQGDVWKFLHAQADIASDDLPFFELAMALGLVLTPGMALDPYRTQIQKVVDDIQEWLDEATSEGLPDNLDVLMDVATKVIHHEYGFTGDDQDFDNIENANILRVIDRRKGLPIALGILYLVILDHFDCQVAGLNFPGHFIVRVQKDGQSMIIDPFRDGRILQAHDLREILKAVSGENAELSHDYYTEIDRREVLVRLQNNVEKRLITEEEYAKAIEIVDASIAFAPDEYRLYLDSGVLRAKLGEFEPALTALETYIAISPDPQGRHEAEAIIHQIKMGYDSSS